MNTEGNYQNLQPQGGFRSGLFLLALKEGDTRGFGFILIFPESVNIGEIPTDTVKSTLDCLLPIIGGKEGAPEDWRIDELLVERQSGYSSLRIKIFGRSS